MIGDLLHRFLAYSRQPRLGRRGNLLHQQFLPVGEQELPRDRLREIAVGLFDQQAIAEIKRIAMKGERVGIAALAFDFAGKAEKMRPLPQQIEADVGQREIDLEHRRVAGPFRQALAQNQRIVAEAKRVVKQDVLFRHQMFLMCSGIE